jgi:transposase
MSRRREISSIVVVTPEGRLYARPQTASANTRTMLRALPYFRRQLGRPLLIIWDRLNTHRSRAVLQFVASHAGDYALAYLPAYAPELNSEEQANAWLERRMANALPQRLAALDGEHEGLLPCFEHHPQPPVAAIHLVGRHPGRWNTRAEGPLEHPLHELGLRAERHLIRDARLPTVRPLIAPRLGQVGLTVEERVPPRRRVGEQDAHLAILGAARGPRVLALDARRLLALLQEASLVDDQHPTPVAQVLDHVGAQVLTHGARIPAGRGNEALHPVGRGLARPFGELPAIAPLGAWEHRLEVGARPASRLRSAEVGRNPRMKRIELARPARHGPSLKQAAPAAKTSRAGAAKEVQL